MFHRYILIFLTICLFQQKIKCDNYFNKISRRNPENTNLNNQNKSFILNIKDINSTIMPYNEYNKIEEKDIKQRSENENYNYEIKDIKENPKVKENNEKFNLKQNKNEKSVFDQTNKKISAKLISNNNTTIVKTNPDIFAQNIHISDSIPKETKSSSKYKPIDNIVNIEKFSTNDKKLITVPDRIEINNNRNEINKTRLQAISKIRRNEIFHEPIVDIEHDPKTITTMLNSMVTPHYNNYTVFPGVTIQPNVDFTNEKDEFNELSVDNEESSDVLTNSIETFIRNHTVNVDLYKLYEKITDVGKSTETARFAFSKNSFLTGFSLGFLAFALKKLLLPFFIGIQIVKSILIAMFLPSILGSVGKIVGKGVSNFAQSSSSSAGGFNNHGNTGGGGGDQIQDFEFKDTSADSSGAESAGGNGIWSLPPNNMNSIGSNANAHYLMDNLNQNKMNSIHRYHSKYNAAADFAKFGGNTGSFYFKDKPINNDFKVFQNIPPSSHLLANYDPFYSPLLSRIDSVFKQLNYKTESCRERLICAMYNNPAKYAPYSNLISAQLSRELNELRKPTSDNPEILRFFRYMKAAKDGQDEQDCGILYSSCSTGNRGGTLETSPPMVTTYNDINKLVQARDFTDVSLESYE